MVLGYHMGYFYTRAVAPERRKKLLLYGGLAMVLFFVMVRSLNIYGDLRPWQPQATPLFTLLSFLNVTKYPPSLLYILVTIGPALIFLSVTERLQGAVTGWVVTIGRVPLFFYLLHIYVIHLVAMVAALLTGFDPRYMVLDTWIHMQPGLEGYGFGLGWVYLFWLGIVIVLFPFCRWFDNYKNLNQDKWWLSYL